MPLIDEQDLEQNTGLITGRGFNLAHVKMSLLGGTQYTVACLATDHSGSTNRFEKDLLTLKRKVVAGLKLSPVQDMILLRDLMFNQTIDEVHGFVPITGIDESQYPAIVASGGTDLFGTAKEGLESVNLFGSMLADQDYEVAGLLFVITDGEDSGYGTRPNEVALLKQKMLQEEKFASVTTILLGINVDNPRIKTYLDQFKTNGNFDHYFDVQDATPESIARLCNLIVSVSISASKSLSSGQASGPITF